MRKSAISYLAILASSLLLAAYTSRAGTSVYWDFSTNGLAPAINPYTDLSVTAFSVGNVRNVNPILAGNSVSSGYTTAAGFGASGSTNMEAAIFGGALNPLSAPTNTYFSTAFTLDMSASISLTLTDISFGSRATGTGPTAFAVYLSTDGFTSDFEEVGTATASADSTYHAVDISGLNFNLDPGDTVTLRLYGASGTGTSSAANWRVDDFAATFTALPTPEPSSIALATMAGMAGLIAIRRKR